MKRQNFCPKPQSSTDKNHEEDNVSRDRTRWHGQAHSGRMNRWRKGRVGEDMEREGKTRETGSRTAAAGRVHCVVCLVGTQAVGESGHAVIGQALSAARVTASSDADPGKTNSSRTRFRPLSLPEAFTGHTEDFFVILPCMRQRPCGTVRVRMKCLGSHMMLTTK